MPNEFPEATARPELNDEKIAEIRKRQQRCMRPDRDDVPQEPHVRLYYKELRQAELDRGYLLSLLDATPAPTWTDEFPTVEGSFYWVRHKLIPETAHAAQLRDGSLYFTDDTSMSRSYRKDCEFLGPITPTAVNSWDDADALRQRLAQLEGNR